MGYATEESVSYPFGYHSWGRVTQPLPTTNREGIIPSNHSPANAQRWDPAAPTPSNH